MLFLRVAAPHGPAGTKLKACGRPAAAQSEAPAGLRCCPCDAGPACRTSDATRPSDETSPCLPRRHPAQPFPPLATTVGHQVAACPCGATVSPCCIQTLVYTCVLARTAYRWPLKVAMEKHTVHPFTLRLTFCTVPRYSPPL